MQPNTQCSYSWSHNILNFLTWALTTMFYAFQILLRILPAIMMDRIMEKFHMNIAQYGLLSSFYYIGYAGAQIPVGLLLDKFHPRYVISFCLLLCAVGLSLFVIYDVVIYAYLGRLIIGIGSVAGILGVVKAIDDYYPNKYSLMLGFSVLVGVGGALLGSYFADSLTSHLWMDFLGYMAIFSACLAVLILIFYTHSHSEDNQVQKTSIWESLRLCLQDKRLWIIGLMGGFMVGPLEGFADVWGVKFFHQVHNLTNDQAAFASVLIFLGLGVGGPIMGYLSKYIVNYSKFIASCGILIFILFAVILLTSNLNYLVLYILCLFIGIFSAYQILIFEIASKVAPLHLVGVATSLINMLIMVFGAFFHSIIGYIIQNHFTPINIGHIRIYDHVAFNSAFAIILIGLVIGVLGFSRSKFIFQKD